MVARSQLLSLMNWNELTQTSPTEYVGSAASLRRLFFPSHLQQQKFKASFVGFFLFSSLLSFVAFSTYGRRRIEQIRTNTRFSVHTWAVLVRIRKTKRNRIMYYQLPTTTTYKIIYRSNCWLALCASPNDVFEMKWNRKWVYRRRSIVMPMHYICTTTSA